MATSLVILFLNCVAVSKFFVPQILLKSGCSLDIGILKFAQEIERGRPQSIHLRMLDV